MAHLEQVTDRKLKENILPTLYCIPSSLSVARDVKLPQQGRVQLTLKLLVAAVLQIPLLN